jgi:predicted RNA-binding Zn-ribbon protein involved in translation (DUF1610 family)
MSERVLSSRAHAKDLARLSGMPATGSLAFAREDRPACQRCGSPVASRPFGCKNPCPNCGTIYPLGDCSD